ncbi:hypothetical protein AB9E28_36215, partial [Rhizobium leguminosarum]|uniref:hypothetical protein n=1 Tax=Rhizobium leguminosarum TaxID=384 RepID=UPI003F98BF4C
LFVKTLDALGAIRIIPFNEHEGEARRVVNVDARPGQLYLDSKLFVKTLDALGAIRIIPFNEHEGEAR